MLYPKGYETLNLVLFNKRKVAPNEHISRFINAFGPHVGDCNPHLREFSNSLTDRAYTWYTTLTPGSTRILLNNTHQKHGEDLVTLVKRFYDFALDCYDEKNEKAFVKICISNIVADYKVYLENIGINYVTFPKGKGLLHYSGPSLRTTTPSSSLTKTWKWFSLTTQGHCTWKDKLMTYSSGEPWLTLCRKWDITGLRDTFTHWEEVQDLSGQEFLAVANVLAFTLPQCSRVVLPEGRVVYRL
ncbi:hypothetical protein D8674_021762 [Pyrus ussuriensis x Pyrus communis]|uniref:Uncharacterized protein n=1 Tax=Pyrus ussuriensis x Pyrus communis TaxID=2448454 RepID=A0A5N5GWL1_9ROSA|nr:hypothetical protein D8674_021762 [Pyrus ussuriensis x Pyrus communis]